MEPRSGRAVALFLHGEVNLAGGGMNKADAPVVVDIKNRQIKISLIWIGRV